MEPRAIIRTAIPGIIALFENEAEVMHIHVGERNIAYWLAHYLHPCFPDWRVDYEYDRREDERKRLPLPKRGRPGEMEVRLTIPDIIVHRRKTRENLLAIEVKKAENKKIEHDFNKLAGLTDPDGDYGYQCGLHLVIDCERRRVGGASVFVMGALERGLSVWLTIRLNAAIHRLQQIPAAI